MAKDSAYEMRRSEAMRSAAVRGGVEAVSIDGATEPEHGVGPTCAYSASECVPGRERQSRFLSGTCLRECNPTLVRLATYVPADSGTGSRNFHHTDVTESENASTDVDAPNRDEQRV